ncbi:MAG: transcription termination factor Rho [Planctomycetota bacterium]
MSKRRRSRSHGRQGMGGGQPGQFGPGGAPGGAGGGGPGGHGYGGRRGRGRYRRGGGGGGGGPSVSGAGAVGMDGEGMRAPDAEPEVAENGEPIPLEPGAGVLEMHPNGYGFLRSAETNYTRERTDPFVPGTMIERFRLREGVFIKGMVQPGRRQQGPRVREILEVEGMAPDEYPKVKTFDQLTPINPETWLRLETGQQPLTTRIMDLLTPLGKGQRALIVAPPRTGKTVLLQQVSQAVSANHPDLSLVMLLIDERPEEVTDMRRTVKGEVLASSLDCDVESHVRLSQLVIERCKRMAEAGKDVFLLMDSITRMARAFNKWVGNTGRTMSGGVDIKALDIPKKLFATARVFEEGGSLTIVATALVDTGSRMDELIFQEFKGTGNMELVLDRKLADRRVWPSIDISQSGTRREEKLLDPDTLHAVNMLRRTLSSMHHVDAMEQLTKQLAKFKSNREFISLIASSRSGE